MKSLFKPQPRLQLKSVIAYAIFAAMLSCPALSFADTPPWERLMEPAEPDTEAIKRAAEEAAKPQPAAAPPAPQSAASKKEQEKREREKKEAEKREPERVEKAQKELDKKEQKRIERERKEAEKKEKERQKRERKEQEKRDKEKKAAPAANAPAPEVPAQMQPQPVTRSREPAPPPAAPVPEQKKQPEPAKSEPAKSEPVKSESIKSEPIKSEAPAKPAEPVKSEPIKAEPVKSEPVKSEPVKSEPVKSEPVKSEPVKSEAPAKPVEQPKSAKQRAAADDDDDAPPKPAVQTKPDGSAKGEGLTKPSEPAKTEPTPVKQTEPAKAEASPSKPAEPAKAEASPPKPAAPAKTETPPPKPPEPAKAEAAPPKPVEPVPPAPVVAAEPSPTINEPAADAGVWQEKPKSEKNSRRDQPSESRFRLCLRAAIGYSGLGGHEPVYIGQGSSRTNSNGGGVYTGLDGDGDSIYMYNFHDDEIKFSATLGGGVSAVLLGRINSLLSFSCGLQYSFYAASGNIVYDENEYGKRNENAPAWPLSEASVELHSLEIPALIRISAEEVVGCPIYGEAGLQLGFNVYARRTEYVGGELKILKPNLNIFAIGPVFGVGIDLDRIFVDLRAHFGFMNYQEYEGGKPWSITIGVTSCL